MAQKRPKKITFTLMYDGKEIDRLPEDYCRRKMDEIGKVVSNYFSNHIDEWRVFRKHLEEEKEHPELELERMKKYLQ